MSIPTASGVTNSNCRPPRRLRYSRIFPRLVVAISNLGMKPYRLNLLESSLKLLHYLGHGSIFHLVQGQTMGFKRPMMAQNISNNIGFCASIVESRVIEHIARSNQHAFGKLKTGGNNSGRTVKAGGVALSNGYRHQWTVM